jgi:hypothetical protein
MPHRATYFFPRQFPEKRLDESSSKKILDHEKKQFVGVVKSTDTTFCVESDAPKTSSVSVVAGNNKDDVVFSSVKNSAVSDLLTVGDKFRSEQKQIAAFCDWLVDKRHNHHHRRRHHHHQHRHRHLSEDEDREVLLPHHDDAKSASPEKDAVDVDVDRSFDREVSLPRLSSGSSYATSLFASDVTVTATFSSDDITKEDTSSFLVSRNEVTRRNEQQKQKEKDDEEQHEEEKRDGENYAKKYKESYELQLASAKRISFLSSLASEPVLTFDTGLETWDVELVSRRLWVRIRYLRV